MSLNTTKTGKLFCNMYPKLMRWEKCFKGCTFVLFACSAIFYKWMPYGHILNGMYYFSSGWAIQRQVRPRGLLSIAYDLIIWCTRLAGPNLVMGLSELLQRNIWPYFCMHVYVLLIFYEGLIWKHYARYLWGFQFDAEPKFCSRPHQLSPSSTAERVTGRIEFCTSRRCCTSSFESDEPMLSSWVLPALGGRGLLMGFALALAVHQAMVLFSPLLWGSPLPWSPHAHPRECLPSFGAR